MWSGRPWASWHAMTHKYNLPCLMNHFSCSRSFSNYWEANESINESIETLTCYRSKSVASKQHRVVPLVHQFKEWGSPQNTARGWLSAAEQGAAGWCATCSLSSPLFAYQLTIQARLNHVNKAGITHSQGDSTALSLSSRLKYTEARTLTHSDKKIQLTALKLIRVWNSRYLFL